jgi:inner membrane protein
MASIGHIAAGMAAARLAVSQQPTRGALARSMLLWSALSLAPDADVVGFAWGVRYEDPWGQRGATHSFAFALAVAALMGLAAWRLRERPLRVACLAALVLASHGVLDTLTDGGRGCALFWPFSDARHFAPYRPIPVAPIGLGFLSARGLRVALAELVLFAPVWVYALWPRRQRREAS